MDNNHQQPQGKICYGDCFRCSYEQAWMCSSMHARRSMMIAEQLSATIETLTNEVEQIRSQVNSLQDKFTPKTDKLINPLEKKAQKPVGVDSRTAEPKQKEPCVTMEGLS
jgi:hypothetical protein